MTKPFNWKDVSDERLTMLAAAHSAREISILLGVSRNAVIARCSRRNIPLCSVKPKRTDTGHGERSTFAGRRAKLAAVEPVMIFVDHLRLTFMQLRPDSCRWPLWKGDVPFSEKRYCGVRAPAGKPYCDHCRPLSYQAKKDGPAKPFKFARAA